MVITPTGGAITVGRVGVTRYVLAFQMARLQNTD